ncbi:hypothetical protein SK128_020379 [Halocaridina rubra]|uniref:Uncharacterized protein n=1 Tax=Halocaridina rubra TaxID=373956 RepID=A0AAN8WYI2_HALRR
MVLICCPLSNVTIPAESHKQLPLPNPGSKLPSHSPMEGQTELELLAKLDSSMKIESQHKFLPLNDTKAPSQEKQQIIPKEVLNEQSQSTNHLDAEPKDQLALQSQNQVQQQYWKQPAISENIKQTSSERVALGDLRGQPLIKQESLSRDTDFLSKLRSRIEANEKSSLHSYLQPLNQLYRSNYQSYPDTMMPANANIVHVSENTDLPMSESVPWI